jgi:Holliday junction DNA helicase RuvA
MIRSLTGIIDTLFTEAVLLDVQGVGYEVLVSSRHAGQLNLKQGSEVRVSIYTHVKEDALQLFGFASEQERELFVQLLSVSGVGPRTALSVLDKGSGEVVSAIQNSDVAFFQGVPRLGKKTAQKIIVDLQSKLGKIHDLALGPVSSTLREVQDALVGMGFAEANVREALLGLDEELDVAEALKQALKKLKKG